MLLFVGHTSIQAQTTKEELDALVKDFNTRIFEEKVPLNNMPIPLKMPIKLM